MKTANRLLQLTSVTVLLILAAMLLLPATALAASGIFGGGISVNARSGGNTDYTVSSFNGADLGTIGCGETLLFVGGYVDTYKSSGSDVTGASINYRVYPQGSPSGSFTNLNAPFLCNKGTGECSGFATDGDQRWRKSDGTTDIAAGLGPGTYTIEVYSQAEATNPTQTHHLSNGGANYKATFAVVARSKATGNWNSGSTWEGDAVPATNAKVEICTGQTATLDTDPTIRSLKILGVLQDTGDANILTIEGTSSEAPTFINAGTFTAGSGTVHFKGQSVVPSNYQNGKVWGSSATSFNNVILTYNGSGNTANDVFGVDFYDQSTSARATINGVLTMNTQTFVAHAENGITGTAGTDGAPFYGSNSTLKYNNTGSFNSAEEWKTGSTCGSAGVPYNVEIANTTTVNIANAHTYGANSAKTACGNVVIGAGSTLQSTSNTLSVKGNWTNNNGASGFTHNSGTVRFNGDKDATQTLVGDTTFCNVLRADATDSDFDWGNGTTTTIAGTYNVNSGSQYAGTNTTVTFTGACGTGPHEIGGGTGAKRFVNIILASGNLQHTGSGNINVTGNWTNNGATFNGSTRTVVLNGSAAQTIGGTSSTTFNNLTLDNAAGANLGIGQTVNGTLTLTNGRITLGAYNLTLGPSAPAVAGTLSASKMVVADGNGALCKRFDATGSYSFPIGDVSGPGNTAEYSPATLNFTGGTFDSGAQACVRVVDAAHPNGDQTNYPTYITRYWPVTQTGISSFNCTATFNYVEADEVIGSGQGATALYHWSYSGGTWALHNQANAATNTLSSNVTSFSDHTARSGSPLAVTLAAFTADAAGEGVTLAWETVSELDNAGFNIYRMAGGSVEDRPQPGDWLAFVPAGAPGSSQGNNYSYRDADVVAGATYWYWLADVDLAGATTLHEPVAVTVGTPNAVGLAGFGATAAGPSLAGLVALALVALAGAGARRRRR